MGNDEDPTGTSTHPSLLELLDLKYSLSIDREVPAGNSWFPTQFWDLLYMEGPRKARWLHRVSFQISNDLIYTEALFRYPDKVRGVLNEGGLFAERQGWHLPGFDTSTWPSRELSEGLPSGGAGVGFFVTTFDLNVPEESDVLMSFVYDGDTVSGQSYRSLVFVNGWQYGKVSILLCCCLPLRY